MIDLSLYLHSPFCLKRCGYCSFVSYAGRESDIPSYIEALETEIALRRVPDTEINTVYFGGGTPSLISAKNLSDILETVRENYPISDGAELTLEANPGTINAEYLEAIRSIGINRLSLGVQSLDDAELKLLGRIHSSNEALEAIQQAKRSGFENLSVDFIYGIPGRAPEKWETILRKIVKLGAQHISLYGLTLEEDTPMFQQVKRGELAAPDQDSSASEYERAEEILDASGYAQYEISNWSLPGYESRHNLAYWERKPYLGVGVAAHSFLGSRRIANTDDLDEYLENLKQGKLAPQTIDIIDGPGALSEALFLGLRLNKGVDAGDIDARFGISLYSRFAGEIAELVSLGLLERRGSLIKLTPRGRLLGNEVFIRFLS
jgi:oxygen-independent coproporphyrinogen-3 oxidase